MATPGEMVAITADALGIPAVTVGSFYRAIREADLVKTGGRGRSAATVGALDVARLLVAVLASDLVKEAPEAVRAFGGLINTYSEVDAVLPPKQRFGLGVGHRFEDAVAQVLTRLSAPQWQNAPVDSDEADLVHRYLVQVDVADREGRIEDHVESLMYAPAFDPARSQLDEPERLRIQRSVRGPVLLTLARLIPASPTRAAPPEHPVSGRS